MAFIQPPGPDHGNPHQVHIIQRDPKGADRPFEQGGEGDIKGKSACLQEFRAFPGFLFALGSEVHVLPAGKTVFQVPLTLTVTEQNQLQHL